MKKELTWVAMTTFLMAATSCSQSEIDNPVDQPVSKPVTLGVNVGVNKTKAAVTGTAITYDEKNYAKTAYGIGIVVTNAEVSSYYAATTANFAIGYDYTNPGYDICFMGDAAGSGWKAIDVATFPTSITTEKAKPFYLDKNPGKIFAYYPYDKAASSSRKKATIADGAVTYPVTVSATTTTPIDGSVANAAKSFATSWAENKTKNPVNISTDEIDYLYFRPDDGYGRLVNNGSNPGADGVVTAPASPNNTDETNPGNSIALSMKHALSMVTFRLYDKDLVAKAPTGTTPNASTLGSVASFKISNVTTGSGVFKVGDATMKISNDDATATDVINTETATGEELTRTLKDYYLIRARATGTKDPFGTQEKASKVTYLYGAGEDGRTVANYISTLVYPIADLAENSVKVEFQIAEPGLSNTFPLEAILPVPTDADGNSGWLPNKNYIYTFSVSKKGLSVVDVKVADWESVEIDEVIDL